MYGKQIVNHIGALGSKVRKYFALGRATRAARGIASLDPAAAGLGGEVPVPASAENSCTNCGASLDGPYCADCGQRDRDLRRPLWFLFADLGDEIFSWDSRVFQTLGPLLFMPGALTHSFWDGKRSRHVPPIRLYLFSSIFFFVVVALADVAILKFTIAGEPAIQEEPARVVEAQKEAVEALRAAGMAVPPELQAAVDASAAGVRADGGESGDEKNSKISVGDVEYGLDVQMFAPMDETEGEDPAAIGLFDDAYKELDENREDASESKGKLLDFVERVLHGFERAARDPGRLNDALNNWIPLTMIVLLPVFAIILRGFYWGKNHRLIKQMVFSLHFHSYIFLILAFLIIAQKAWGTAASSWMFFAAVPLYLFLGLRTASQQGWIRTFFKFSMISLIYVILMTITVTTAVLMGLAEI